MSERNAEGPAEGAEGRAPPTGGSEPPLEGEHAERAPIHLGGHRRPDGHGADGDELAPFSRTASGLSALGRAQARAHALTEQIGEAATPPAAAAPSDKGAVEPTTRSGDRPPAETSRTPGAPSGRSEPASGPRPPSRPRNRRAAPRKRPPRRGASLTFAGRRNPRRRRGGLHRSRQQGRFLKIALRLLVAGAVVVVLVALFVAVQAKRGVPRPALRTTLATAATVVGPVPTLPWPHSGEAAVAVAGLGAIGSAGPSTPVPIASLAKVMAAVVVLHNHPLAPGQAGPHLTMTAADQAIYQADQAAGDSVAPVMAGESLSELQLLEALLIPSADNLAPVVAAWDAGSEPAFVTKMNSEAAALGLRATHYADVDGIAPGTVSTASDQLRLAEVAAANPVLMAIVRQPQVSLPNAPGLANYDTALGQDGIVGIKTGSTTEAGGCFMFAANGTVSGHHVQILGVVLGQTTTPLIPAALDASRSLITPVLARLHPVIALPAGTVVGHISSPWGSSVSVTTAAAVTVLHLGRLPVNLAVTAATKPLSAHLPAGSQVATVTVTAGGQSQTVPAVTGQALRGPSLRWRLERL